MAQNFSKLLINRDRAELENMPPIIIDKREDDVSILYNKNKMRLDRIAGDVYQDETMWKVILWANPEYDCEYDIPDDTIIRVPLPKNDVLSEVTSKIINKKDLG
jgi:hypothetical protein